MTTNWLTLATADEWHAAHYDSDSRLRWEHSDFRAAARLLPASWQGAHPAPVSRRDNENPTAPRKPRRYRDNRNGWRTTP